MKYFLYFLKQISNQYYFLLQHFLIAVVLLFKQIINVEIGYEVKISRQIIYTSMVIIIAIII